MSDPAAKPGSVPLPDPVESAMDSDAASVTKRSYGWLSATIAIIFGLFYAYDLFEAISNTIIVSTTVAEFNKNVAQLGIPTGTVPWVILVIDIALAPVVFVAAFLIGLRQGVLSKALVFLLGLAVVAALTLSLEEGFVRLFG
ncbi:MAG: hypothetical protein JWO10_1597 [Microbacteriaceae bacterium]|nr:hypothetical protein [Microbacteriaceae bacterium]